MTQEQFDVRSKRAAQELFVISPTDNGWRVRSAHNPSQYYLVSGDGEDLRCSCSDFETHSEDPDWICKHILAVQNHQAKTHGKQECETYEDEERAAIQSESSPLPQNAAINPQAQMLVKRSLSPDGRIDSISLEFSFDVREESAGDIKARALKALKLQTEIVQSFLGSAKPNGRSNGAARHSSNNKDANGTVAARMLDVGITQTTYGERVYVNFDVNGRRARLFGSEQAVLSAIAAAGKRLAADAIQQGLMLNLPCRVVTEQNGNPGIRRIAG
jgi:SWIM zinc finger